MTSTHVTDAEAHDDDEGALALIDSSDVALLLSAAFSLYGATQRLSALDAESRAVARLASESLMRGDVSHSALALVANVEGRAGIVDLLRGSARSQPD